MNDVFYYIINYRNSTVLC